MGDEYGLALANHGHEELKRHPRFYHADGDCTIRVQDTLFRVCVSLLIVGYYSTVSGAPFPPFTRLVRLRGHVQHATL